METEVEIKAKEIIKEVMKVSDRDITNFMVLEKGMTNNSFTFECNNEKYIIRIPGKGTDKFVNRIEEAEVYSVINGKNICDDIIYINQNNGYRITKFLKDAVACDPNNFNQVLECMIKLRKFHNLKLKVNHKFDVFEEINFYERLLNGKKSEYSDYDETKKNVFLLKEYIENHVDGLCLCHIDSVPDNFLFSKDKDGNTDIRLIDWEYAGMQDPHIDIAMFGIYSLYNKEQIDKLIDGYFEEGCSIEIRIKIYCYIAVCGLLWSNWCEFKKTLGIDFGDYALKQYEYAKEYYKIAKNEMKKL